MGSPALRAAIAVLVVERGGLQPSRRDRIDAAVSLSNRKQTGRESYARRRFRLRLRFRLGLRHHGSEAPKPCQMRRDVHSKLLAR